MPVVDVPRTKNCRVVLLFLLLGVPACSREEMPDGPRVPVVPVTGKVLVDGQPASNLRVVLHNSGTKPDTVPTSSDFTDDQGVFEIGTFEAGDGAPIGSYQVTFMWGRINLMSGRYEGPDQLKDRYSKPDKSGFQVNVKESEPVDMGEIQLTTK